MYKQHFFVTCYSLAALYVPSTGDMDCTALVNLVGLLDSLQGERVRVVDRPGKRVQPVDAARHVSVLARAADGGLATGLALRAVVAVVEQRLPGAGEDAGDLGHGRAEHGQTGEDYAEQRLQDGEEEDVCGGVGGVDHD